MKLGEHLNSEMYVSTLMAELNLLQVNALDELSQIIFSSWKTDQNVWIAGNGGNSANAQHFATDWSKGLFLALGKSLRITPLSSNGTLFSAIANDLPKEEVFAFQLQMWAQPGDIAILMSAGGSSKNIEHANAFCKRNSIFTIGIIGGYKPILKGIFDFELHIPVDDIQIVEDLHSIIGHIVYKNIISIATLYKN